MALSQRSGNKIPTFHITQTIMNVLALKTAKPVDFMLSSLYHNGMGTGVSIKSLTAALVSGALPVLNGSFRANSFLLPGCVEFMGGLYAKGCNIRN